MASKSISKSVIWLLLGKFALQGIAFFTTPVFTRLLSPDDYGYTTIYMSWCSILGLIIGLQTRGSIQNALLKYEYEERNSYFSSIMTISVISFVICIAIALIFNSFLSNLLLIRKDLVILVVIQSFATYIITFYTDRYNALKQVQLSTMISIVQAVFCIGLSLFFVLYYSDNKAIAKIYGNAIPLIIIGFVFIIRLYIKGRCFWNSKYNKYCLKLVLPLVFHGLGHLVFTQTDRIMLQRILGEEMLGIYGVSFSLCSVLSVIYTALNSAWLPFYYDMKRTNQKNQILIHSKRYIRFFGLITIGFVLLSYEVFKIMAPTEYYEGMEILPLFVCSHFFNFLYLFPVNYEFYHEKTKLIPFGTLGAAFINIMINLIMIPKFSILGAAIGTLVAHVTLFVFHEIIAIYFVKEEYEYKTFMTIFIWIGIIVVVCLFLFLFTFKWFIRWGLAIIIGTIITINIVKYKSFF